MNLCERAVTLDEVLDRFRVSLGADFTAYRNHCYRLLNFGLAFAPESADGDAKLSIAAAFHDLGIWTDNTFDYLTPSCDLARAYLKSTNQASWADEIEAMIHEHHKITRYRSNPAWLVEPFRKADWTDVSRGILTFGLPAVFVRETMTKFPNAGFHNRLVALAWQRFKAHPLDVLPMMKL